MHPGTSQRLKSNQDLTEAKLLSMLLQIVTHKICKRMGHTNAENQNENMRAAQYLQV